MGVVNILRMGVFVCKHRITLIVYDKTCHHGLG